MPKKTHTEKRQLVDDRKSTDADKTVYNTQISTNRFIKKKPLLTSISLYLQETEGKTGQKNGCGEIEVVWFVWIRKGRWW